MAVSSQFDILISGFGPTGATLAALLGQRGFRVGVFDKHRDIYPLPRAVALDHEVLRNFQRAGLEDVIGDVAAPYRTTLYKGADGQTIQQIETVAEPYPLAWPPNMTFNQPALEKALRQRVMALPNVDVLLEHEVISFRQNADAICAQVRKADSSLFESEGAFLIACDGAQSPLRVMAGIGLEDMQFEQDWIVSDVIVREDILQRLPQTNVQYCDPRRPTTFVVCPGAHRRWEFRLLPGESFTPDDNAMIRRLLKPWLGEGEGEIWRTASYRFAARMAERWRAGRLILAGDAAHQMPPFLGQGMCQGIRDAANLDWKLARIVEGVSSPSLLDTYEAERKWHVRAVTKVAVGLGEIIGELDPHKAHDRDARLLAAQGGAVKAQVRQAFIPGISQSALVAAGGIAGTVFPQPYVHSGGGRRRLDDLIGAQALLVLREAPAAAAASALVAAAQCAGIHVMALTDGAAAAGVEVLDECDDVLAAWFTAHGGVAALVRPDHYVFATAAQIDKIMAMINDYRAALM